MRHLSTWHWYCTPDAQQSVAGLAEVTKNADVLKKLLDGERKTWPAGWSCLAKGCLPAEVLNLPDGASIDRLVMPQIPHGVQVCDVLAAVIEPPVQEHVAVNSFRIPKR